jgi:hypothetical protein
VCVVCRGEREREREREREKGVVCIVFCWCKSANTRERERERAMHNRYTHHAVATITRPQLKQKDPALFSLSLSLSLTSLQKSLSFHPSYSHKDNISSLSNRSILPKIIIYWKLHSKSIAKNFLWQMKNCWRRTRSERSYFFN